MKLAYYHKEYRGDFVWLAKGRVPDGVSDTVQLKLENSKYYTAWHNIAVADEILRKKHWDSMEHLYTEMNRRCVNIGIYFMTHNLTPNQLMISDRRAKRAGV